MAKIEVTPDADGRIIVELYGEKLEIDETMFDDKGVAVLKKFGEEYEIYKNKPKNTKKKTETSEVNEAQE